MLRLVLLLSLFLGLAASLALLAQTAPTNANAGSTMQAQADLNQLMRGVLYPAANVVFSAQTDDPGDKRPPDGTDPSMATDPLLSTFGSWVAVENAALALAESANLLMVPGRSCANGEPVPLNNPDWAKFVQQLRDAGMQAYQAARAKDQDKMIEVAGTISVACDNCHRKWRARAANRCK